MIIKHFILFICILFFVIEYLKYKRHKEIIAIDLDCLADIEAIEKRCKIFTSNNKNVNYDSYMAAHITEQQPIPKGMLKAIKYQRLGYKIIYFSCRNEKLRVDTAKFLNDWDLKGELYMKIDSSISNDDFKVAVINYIKKYKGKISGVLLKNYWDKQNVRNICKIQNII